VERTFEFKTGRVIVPGHSVKTLLQVDVYLRQRYFYRNDGQNGFNVHSNPFVQIESPALPAPLKFAVLGNGLHLAAAKTLLAGESGHDSRGNFGRVIITAAGIDQGFGAGTAAKMFKDDITISMFVANTIRGVHHFVVGTFTQIYGS
jgi:hypothetical protein